MTHHPPNAQLMAATIDYLEAHLLPTLSGEHRFKTRLAMNALKMLQRSQPDEQDGIDRDNPLSPQALAEKIRQKNVALDEPALLLTLERQLQQSLKINNPKWLID